MRAKLEALHKQYQDDFNRDAKQTLGDFEKTKVTLAERFARLQGIDTGAEGGAGKQLNVLQRQRSDLYEQMVAQIGREVKLIAAKRGIDVVLSDVVAPAGGVDLTPDAEKDIESLHEGNASFCRPRRWSPLPGVPNNKPVRSRRSTSRASRRTPRRSVP